VTAEGGLGFVAEGEEVGEAVTRPKPHKEVEIAVGPGFAPGVRAEHADTVYAVALGDRAQLVDSGAGNWGTHAAASASILAYCADYLRILKRHAAGDRWRVRRLPARDRAAWHLAPRAAIEDAASLLLVRATPLLEEEGNVSAAALVANVSGPA
jgi:hypothetical protein